MLSIQDDTNLLHNLLGDLHSLESQAKEISKRVNEICGNISLVMSRIQNRLNIESQINTMAKNSILAASMMREIPKGQRTIRITVPLDKDFKEIFTPLDKDFFGILETINTKFVKYGKIERSSFDKVKREIIITYYDPIDAKAAFRALNNIDPKLYLPTFLI